MKQLLFLLLLAPFLGIGQTVTGKVTTHTGNPIPGATVTNRTISTQTATTGAFTIAASLGDTLHITHTGYEPAVAVIRQIVSVISITLTSADQTLAAVTVATGYQRLPRERATGSFSVVGEGLLNRSVTTDVLSRLEGTAPGLFFDKRLPGATLSIRGRSTIYAGRDPLVIVDNFPYEGDIANINPADVESVTLLKDAAAASIWGTRAANGVIVISTRKGRVGAAPSLSVTANATVQDKPDLFALPQMSAASFIEVERFLFAKGFYNSQETSPNRLPLSPVVELLIRARSGALSAAALEAELVNLYTVDVRRDMDRYLYQRAIRQQYAATLTGGGTAHAYGLSLGYDRNWDNLAATFGRYTARLSNSWQWSRRGSLEAAVVYTQTAARTGRPSYSNITPAAAKDLYPYARLADSAGNALPVLKDYRGSYITAAKAAGLLDWSYIPLEDYKHTDNRTASRDLVLNLGATYKLTSALSLEARYQYEGANTEAGNQQGLGSYNTRNTVNRYTQSVGGTLSYPVPVGAILDLESSTLSAHAGRGQLSYNKAWSKGSLTAIAGGEVRESALSGSFNRVYGYDGEILTYTNVNYDSSYRLYYNNSLRSTIAPSTGFRETVNRYVSSFANAAYTWRGRYTVSASLRRDASNLFGVATNQKGVPLWSAGASWSLDKESFYRWSAVPRLKLRATYGHNGNVDNSLSAYTTISYFNSGNSFITGAYAGVSRPANPDLRWERVGTLNAGIDFEGRILTGSVEYYRKEAADLIGDAPVDPTVGWPSGKLRRNIGAMINRGVDVELTARVVNSAFGWSVTLLGSWNSARLTEYDSISSAASAYLTSGISTVPAVGKPLNNIFSYPWAGLDAAGDPLGIVNGQPSKDYLAISRTPVSGLVYHGSATPVVFGWLRNTFNWRGIELSANLSYRFGYYFRRASVNYNNLFNSWRGHSDYDRRWQSPGDEAFTSVPSMVYPVNTRRESFYENASVLVEKGDNIRLHDIRLGYTLKKAKAGWLPVRSVQFYGFAQNIGILWRANRHGLDPDYYATNLPAPLALTLGLKATF
ncbi:MAG: TonB-linked outer membrane protein SusC/RagA family [Flaviaesturariibacter sp.]|nr:TonB-linked outer membrane protein SusC/RagA family [Flaviaesturariibacter sp.]